MMTVREFLTICGSMAVFLLALSALTALLPVALYGADYAQAFHANFQYVGIFTVTYGVLSGLLVAGKTGADRINAWYKGE